MCKSNKKEENCNAKLLNVDEIDTYFTRMLNKEVYNKTGLIYGIGHAVYTISDPRALLLKELARDLAREKGKEREFAFLELLEERAIATFGREESEAGQEYVHPVRYSLFSAYTGSFQR